MPGRTRPSFQERKVTRTSAAAVDKAMLTFRSAVSIYHSLVNLIALKTSMRHIVPPQGTFS